MSKASFKTNRRLWVWLTLVLFCASWWLPLLGKTGQSWISLFWSWLIGVSRGEIPLRASLGVIAYLAASACFALVAALVVGWLLQCVVVIVRTKKNEPVDKAT